MLIREGTYHCHGWGDRILAFSAELLELVVRMPCIELSWICWEDRQRLIGLKSDDDEVHHTLLYHARVFASMVWI